MSNDSDRTQNIPVKLKNGRTILVEVTQTGREDVASEASEFKELDGAIVAFDDLFAYGYPDIDLNGAGVVLRLSAITQIFDKFFRIF
jgi:hypothetical protein